MRPQVQTAAVSTIDVAAMLLALAGADLRAVDGVNLLPVLTGARPMPPHRPVFLELHRYLSADGHRTHDLKAVVLDGWKYILDRIHATRALYHLTDDPTESHNLAGRRRLVEAELDGVLSAFVNRGERAFPPPR